MTHEGGPTGQESGRAEREASQAMTRVGDLRAGTPRVTQLRRTASAKHSHAERGYIYRENRPAARWNQGQQHRGYRNDRCPLCGRGCAGDRLCPVEVVLGANK